MNAWAWIALALVLLPAAVGWYICFRSLFARYLERHDEAQRVTGDQIVADYKRMVEQHRTPFQRKREALDNASIVRLTKRGPKAEM